MPRLYTFHSASRVRVGVVRQQQQCIPGRSGVDVFTLSLLGGVPTCCIANCALAGVIIGCRARSWWISIFLREHPNGKSFLHSLCNHTDINIYPSNNVQQERGTGLTNERPGNSFSQRNSQSTISLIIQTACHGMHRLRCTTHRDKPSPPLSAESRTTIISHLSLIQKKNLSPVMPPPNGRSWPRPDQTTRFAAKVEVQAGRSRRIH